MSVSAVNFDPNTFGDSRDRATQLVSSVAGDGETGQWRSASLVGNLGEPCYANVARTPLHIRFKKLYFTRMSCPPFLSFHQLSVQVEAVNKYANICLDEHIST